MPEKTKYILKPRITIKRVRHLSAPTDGYYWQVWAANHIVRGVVEHPTFESAQAEAIDFIYHGITFERVYGGGKVGRITWTKNPIFMTTIFMETTSREHG